MATFTYTLPTVSGSEDTWGATLNANWTALGTFLGSLDSAKLVTLNNVTASAAELNRMDGITASTAELNTLDGITASTAELNLLDGVNLGLTAAEINRLNGLTSTTAELNVLDHSTNTPVDVSLQNADGVVVNDVNGDTGMKQVRMSSVRDYVFDALSVDEDNMASDSATLLPTQQSVKAYVDDNTVLYEPVEIATTSGTQHDVVSIPAGINRIEIMIRDVSVSAGTGDLLIQIGGGGSPNTTAYDSDAVRPGRTAARTDGMVVATLVNTPVRGHMWLTRVPDTNIWMQSHMMYINTGSFSYGTGQVTLGARVNVLRLTTTNGDTFSGGGLSIRCSR